MKNKPVSSQTHLDPGCFYYKKPAVAFETNQTKCTINSSRRNSSKHEGLSKTKHIQRRKFIEHNSLQRANKSVVDTAGYQDTFAKKSSMRNITQMIRMRSPKHANISSPQVNKLSPRSLMNIKSKEILYKNFLKEFKACTLAFDKTISKEELYVIMRKMGYFNKSKDNTLTHSENRYIDYLFRLSK